MALCLLFLLYTGCSASAKDTVKIKSGNALKTSSVIQDEDYQFMKPKSGDVVANIKTNHGEIKVKLFKDIAPKAVQNFIGLANKGYYDGVTFHRVIKDFMIQGGDPTGTGSGGESIWNTTFEDEFSEKVHHYRGALSMANRGPNTNTSQFFIVQNSALEDGLVTYLRKMNFDENLLQKYINFGGTPHLDGKHTVFGQVYEGLDIVDEIANVKVSSYNNKPIEDVVILNICIENVQ
ncbi:MAG: peptidylprolyl isomerase [Clostridiales bacterium]|nr:peptidylprolyl isomerase [Clostridiales bacterium]